MASLRRMQDRPGPKAYFVVDSQMLKELLRRAVARWGKMNPAHDLLKIAYDEVDLMETELAQDSGETEPPATTPGKPVDEIVVDETADDEPTKEPMTATIEEGGDMGDGAPPDGVVTTDAG